MTTENGTRVRGRSDDLVCFSGDLHGEIGCYGTEESEAVLIAFSDGTVLNAWYGDDGIWRLRVLNKGVMFEGHETGTDPDGDDYSDTATFKPGPLRAWWGKEASVVN